MRDFSAADASVPPELRGTYAAFTVDSFGTRHLRTLAGAGIDTLHLLPIFDIASVPEDRADQRVPEIPADASAASRRPQAAVTAVADRDAYSWGYDPYHWMVPEGSYAREGHQDGGARTREVREMVGALHGMGLQMVLDQAAAHIPIIANGDIVSPEKARHVLAVTGADALMIGRAAQGRPWLFREIEHFLSTGTHLLPPRVDENLTDRKSVV